MGSGLFASHRVCEKSAYLPNGKELPITVWKGASCGSGSCIQQRTRLRRVLYGITRTVGLYGLF